LEGNAVFALETIGFVSQKRCRDGLTASASAPHTGSAIVLVDELDASGFYSDGRVS
jgi:hypothetical protein